MISLATALRSSVGKKYIMGITGLIWVGFVCGHLVGNFLLLAGREPFNNYAHFLETLGHGKLLYLAEAFLVVTLLSHVVNGFTVAFSDKSKARPIGYQVSGNAGGRSQKGLASQSMIITGSVLLVFLVLHIWKFKFGHTDTVVVQMAPGMRDLYQVVVEKFADPLYAFGYTAVMLLLGVHLSHGIWSAFQSLGLNSRRFMPFLRPLAMVMATALAFGFLSLPLTIHFLNERFQTPHGGLFG